MLLEEIGQHDAAEELYRRFAAESKRPEAVLVLAAYLGRRNRPDEALQLCERAAKTCPAEAVAEVSLEILTTAKVGPEHYQAVSRQIEAAVRQSTDKTSLVMALAVLRRLEGRIRDAITLYRQVVARDPRDALARNNLAWLLALHEENPKEALVHIEEAVKAAGPLATLLDTRAVVQLKLGNSRAAAQDLAEAIADSPTPSRYFHLAQALMQNRDGGEAARAALQRARELGLREEAIDSLELAAYQKLCSDLKPKK
jgi:Tfp pilus assembly protein PilF